MDPNAPSVDTPNPDEDVRSWFRQNRMSIFFGVILIGVVCTFLHPLDFIMMLAGLSLIIFFHELGHFTAAKLCKVRVKTFSFFGLGPAIPGLAWKYGETTYQISVVPLGGYVSMIGEGEQADTEEADSDPRSFKNKSVPERMLIISAGVIMNIILALVLFVFVYMHGLEEQPAVVATLEPGGALWRQNVHTGADIESINGRTGLFFEDVRPLVWNTAAGETLALTFKEGSTVRTVHVEPRQDEGVPFPLLGFAPPASTTLFHHPRDKSPPYRGGSAAAKAGKFEGGDVITGASDPDNPGDVTALKGEFPYIDFEQRQSRLAGQPMKVRLHRKNSTEEITVELPAEMRHDTGLRMRMGRVAAVREDSPAKAAGVKEGDRIVEVKAGDVVFASEAKSGVRALDPLRLPGLLHLWGLKSPGDVTITVLRNVDHSEKRVELKLPWDANGAKDLGEPLAPTSPLAVNGLGIAYMVEAVVDGVSPGSPAEKAGIKPGDVVEAVKFRTLDDGKIKSGRWEEMKPNQWGFVDAIMQRNEPHELELRVARGGAKIEAIVSSVPDGECPIINRGLSFLPEYRIQKADNVVDALRMGVARTLRMVKTNYISLYAMVFGRVSAIQTMSGPITLGRIAYKFAGESEYRLILLLALISINLAVVNFLPIPVLDGGHMVFLIYEGIIGRPPPPRIHLVLTIFGFVCIGSLMLFVIGLDIWRLIKMYLGW